MIPVGDHEIVVGFTPANGVPMLMCVAHDEDDRALVRFYDRRHPHTDWGQFIADYYLVDLLDDDWERRTGLNMHMGVPDWQIDAQTMSWLMRIARCGF